MAKIKAALLDLDGTLRDTRDIIYPALQHAIQVHTGTTPSRDQIAPHVHHHTEVHKVFVPDIDLETFDTTYHSKILELMPKVALYKGTVSLLEQLRAAGYRLATVTAARNARESLKELGLSEYFEVAVGGSEVKEHKPHPEPVLTALRKLDLTAAEAIMIGDLPVDIQAAHAAGLQWTVGITHGFGTRERLEVAGADYIIDSLPELLAILEKIEQN